MSSRGRDDEPGQRTRQKKRKVEAEEAARDAPGSAGRPLAEDAGGGHGRRGETHRNTLRPAVGPSLETLSLETLAPFSQVTQDLTTPDVGTLKVLGNFQLLPPDLIYRLRKSVKNNTE